MQLAAHAPLQGLVDHLMLLHPGLALEGRGDDIGRVVVAVAPFKGSLPSMLPVFTKYIPAFFTATCRYRRFTVVVNLSSFVEGSETAEPCAFTE